MKVQENPKASFPKMFRILSTCCISVIFLFSKYNSFGCKFQTKSFYWSNIIFDCRKSEIYKIFIEKVYAFKMEFSNIILFILCVNCSNSCEYSNPTICLLIQDQWYGFAAYILLAAICISSLIFGAIFFYYKENSFFRRLLNC